MPRPLRAQDYYAPSPSQPAQEWQHIPPAERVIAWYEHYAQRRLARPSDGVLLDGPRYARIDAGRWVADCPCGSAQVVTPDDPRMYCVECQPGGWYPLVFPEDVAAAEQEVADRLRHAQFWWHPDDDSAWNRSHRRPETAKQTRARQAREERG